MRQRNDGENVACVMKRQNGKSTDGLSCSSHTDKSPIDDDVEEEAMFVEKFAFALLHFSAGVSASALPTDLHLPPLEPTPFLRRKRGLHSSPMLQTVSQQP